MTDHPILVAGAGPVGLTLAGEEPTLADAQRLGDERTGGAPALTRELLFSTLVGHTPLRDPLAVQISETATGYGAIGARYGAGEGLLAIVRPDGYLAHLGEPDDVAQAERALAQAIG